MIDPGSAAQRIATYLDHLLRASGFDLEYTLEIQPDSAPITEPALSIYFTGPDVPLLVDRDAELLHAIESVAAALLRLDRSEHHRLLFDAGNLRAERTRSLEQAAAAAVDDVRRTGRPFTFAPMNSRDRRLLHLAVASSGLHTASTGEGPHRSVVLYPPGQTPPPAPPVASRSRRDWPARAPRPITPRSPAASPRPADPDAQPFTPGPSLSSPSQDDRIRALRERFRKR